MDPISEWIAGLVIAGIVGAILQPFIDELFPSEFGSKLRFLLKRFVKFIKNPELDVSMVLQTPDLVDRGLQPASTLESIKSIAEKEGYTPASKQDALVFRVKIGQTNADVDIAIAPETTDRMTLVISQLQMTLTIRCKLRSLSDDVLELTQVQRGVEKIVRQAIGEVETKVTLLFQLKRSYKLLGVFSNYKIDMLSAKNPDLAFDLTQHEIRLYVTQLNRETTEFVRRMIIAYY